MTKVRLPDVPMLTLGRLNGTALYLNTVIYLILPHCYLLLSITYEPRSDKRDLLGIKVKSEIFTENERPSCCEQLQKI